MALVHSRQAVPHQIPQQEAPKGWLRRAITAVREAVSGPQIQTSSRHAGVDTYSSVAGRHVNAPRGLATMCATGGANTKSLKAIPTEEYLRYLKEIETNLS